MHSQLTTRDGKRVILVAYIPTNLRGEFVTFPIKGTIVERERPVKFRYQIWTLDGRAHVLGESPDDLMID
jgi:hypothetical protein